MSDRSATATTASAHMGSDEEASALDRRREKLQARTRAAVATAAEVVALDAQLDANVAKRGVREAALAEALRRVEVLKKKIKASVAEHDELRSGRKDARHPAAAAARCATTAEVKYDRAVLADMLRREKDDDLSAHPDLTTPGYDVGAPRTSATTTRPRS